ncbi:lipoprotein [Serratia plymuthica]|nr:lipoprotein [Serratia plymuthica]
MIFMNIKRVAGVLVLVMATLSVTACGHMSNRNRNTAIGAGVGALGGAVLTDGSTLGTLGGAALGGIIGHQTSR